MRIAAGAVAAAAAKQQAGDLDPRHHHRGGGDGSGGGSGGGGGGAQQEADDHHHQLLQLHQAVQDQAHTEPPSSVPVFQLQHLQAVRQRGLSSAEYALLSPMGDAGQSHAHSHHGFQPQLLSFGGGGVGQQHHHLHQFTAQAPATAASSHSRSRPGGETVAAASHSSRVRGGASGGEIVAVQGGHIVRATGRKDRHSKVCTARGPRDRRVRLSAHTAIQFYDVQDRLGYDRPSKAVDWLIKNAKDAIDKLEVLPAWQPTAANAAAPPSSSTHPDNNSPENSDDQAQAITVAHPGFDFPGAGGGATAGGTGFLPASLDSDSIADTIKSFFPMGGTGGGGGEASSSAAAAHSSAMGGFQSYTPDLLSRTGGHSQELRLSLHSLPDPMFQHQQQEQEHDRSHGGNGNSAQQALFPGAATYSFGGGMWAEQQSQQRMVVPWTVPTDPGGGGAGSYLFNAAAAAAAAHMQLGGQSQFLFQRGPLQSSNNQPSERGWPETVVEEADDTPMHHHHHQAGLGSTVFAPGVGGFSGFRIPARIQGDEEHNGGGGSGNGDKPPPPSSVSSVSHH